MATRTHDAGALEILAAARSWASANGDTGTIGVLDEGRTADQATVLIPRAANLVYLTMAKGIDGWAVSAVATKDIPAKRVTSGTHDAALVTYNTIATLVPNSASNYINHDPIPLSHYNYPSGPYYELAPGLYEARFQTTADPQLRKPMYGYFSRWTVHEQVGAGQRVWRNSFQVWQYSGENVYDGTQVWSCIYPTRSSYQETVLGDGAPTFWGTGLHFDGTPCAGPATTVSLFYRIDVDEICNSGVYISGDYNFLDPGTRTFTANFSTSSPFGTCATPSSLSYQWKRGGQPVCSNSLTCSASMAAGQANDALEVTVTPSYAGSSLHPTGWAALGLVNNIACNVSVSQSGNQFLYSGPETVTMTASASAGACGAGTYSFSWIFSPISGGSSSVCGNSATCSFMYQTPGFLVVTATRQYTYESRSASATQLVIQLLNANMSGPDNLAAGNAGSWSATSTGAYGPYSFKWYLNGTLIQNGGATLETTLPSSATHQLQVEATSGYNSAWYTKYVTVGDDPPPPPPDDPPPPPPEECAPYCMLKARRTDSAKPTRPSAKAKPPSVPTAKPAAPKKKGS